MARSAWARPAQVRMGLRKAPRSPDRPLHPYDPSRPEPGARTEALQGSARSAVGLLRPVWFRFGARGCERRETRPVQEGRPRPASEKGSCVVRNARRSNRADHAHQGELWLRRFRFQRVVRKGRLRHQRNRGADAVLRRGSEAAARTRMRRAGAESGARTELRREPLTAGLDGFAGSRAGYIYSVENARGHWRSGRSARTNIRWRLTPDLQVSRLVSARKRRARTFAYLAARSIRESD